MSTLATDSVGCIETPITTVKSPQCQINDLNTLIHTVDHAYHPSITLPINGPHQDMNQCRQQIEPNQLDLNQTQHFSEDDNYEVQTSEKLIPLNVHETL